MSLGIQVKFLDHEQPFEVPIQKFDRYGFIQKLREAFELPEDKRIAGLATPSGDMIISDSISPDAFRSLGTQYTLLVSAAINNQPSNLRKASTPSSNRNGNGKNDYQQGAYRDPYQTGFSGIQNYTYDKPTDAQRKKLTTSNGKHPTHSQEGTAPPSNLCHNLTLQEIFNLDNFFGTAMNEVKPNTRLALIKVSSKQELEALLEGVPSLPEKTKLYYYIQRGEANERLHFSSEEPAYYILGKSKRVNEYPIGPHTAITEIISKLDCKKNTDPLANIYIREDFNLSENEDRARLELRSLLKHLERSKVIRNCEFIKLAHWVRFDPSSQADLAETIRHFRSDLDKFAFMQKRYHRSERLLAENLTHEGVCLMLEDLAKIKILASRKLSDLIVCLNGQTAKGGQVMVSFAQFIAGKITLKELVKILETVSNTPYNPWSRQKPKGSELQSKYELRPESPIPNKYKLGLYLKKSAPRYFGDQELEILDSLYRAKNKYLICAFDLYVSDRDEAEFLDTVRRLLAKNPEEQVNYQYDEEKEGRSPGDRMYLNLTPVKTEDFDVRSIGTKEIKPNERRGRDTMDIENTEERNLDYNDGHMQRANMEDDDVEDDGFVIHSVKTLPNDDGQSEYASNMFESQRENRQPQDRNTPAFNIEVKQTQPSQQTYISPVVVGQTAMAAVGLGIAVAAAASAPKNGVSEIKPIPVQDIVETKTSPIPVAQPKEQLRNEPVGFSTPSSTQAVASPTPQVNKPEVSSNIQNSKPQFPSIPQPQPQQQEQPPISKQTSGTAELSQNQTNSASQSLAPAEPPQQQAPPPQPTKVETMNKAVASISFCKKGPEKDQFFKNFGSVVQKAPPQEEQPKPQVTSNFSGFNNDDDQKYFERSSDPASVGAFGAINAKPGVKKSIDNESSEAGLPCFAGSGDQNYSITNQQSAPPAFNTNTNASAKPNPPSEVTHTSPAPANDQSNYRTNIQAFESFYGAGFRALMNKNTQPIIEQKEEAENSPNRNSQAEKDKTDSNLRPPPLNLDTDTAPNSPSKSKILSPRSSKQHKAYLGHIVRFVLQNDGADANLAKLCADLVAEQEGSAASFSQDILEISKKKFLKLMTRFMRPIEAEEILSNGQLFSEALGNPTDDLVTVGEKLLSIKEENKGMFNEALKLKENFSKTLYDNLRKNKESQNQKSSFMKLTRMATSNIDGTDLMSEADSKGNKSNRSKLTKYSKRTGIEDRRKNENELTEKIYTAMKPLDGKLKQDLDLLFELARKDGINIDRMQAKNVEDLLDADYTPILEILFNFGYFKEYDKVKKQFSDLLKNLASEAPSVISPRGEHRRSHYLRIKALLKHIKEDTKQITSHMYEFFNDLLTRENWGLISAYELFILNDDREELIDTLFVIYKTLSAADQIEEVVDDKNKVKQTMEGILFHYKTKFDPKVYDKLVDLIKTGDTKTKELHNQYKIDKDEKKFITSLTEYSQEKLRRLEEMKKRLEPTQVDWKADLQLFAETYKDKIKIPDIADYGEIFNMDPDMTKAIYDVYKTGIKDSGDAIENLNLLRNRFIKNYIHTYYGTSLPFTKVLFSRGIDVMKILTIIGDFTILNKTTKTQKAIAEAVQLFEMLEDETDFIDSVQRIYGLKKL
jgi:hypothetical protein